MDSYTGDLRRAQGLLTAYAAILADRETLRPKKSQILRQAEQACHKIDLAIESMQIVRREVEKLKANDPATVNDRALSEVHALQRELLDSRCRENELKRRIEELEEKLEAASGLAANDQVETVPPPKVEFIPRPPCSCYMDVDGGRCKGTKELDTVSCGGDELKCPYRTVVGVIQASVSRGTQVGPNNGSQC